MGNIARILASMELDDPEGWNPEEDQFNLPFAIELKEDVHIHWQDVRLEMDASDFEQFAEAVESARKEWEVDGKPDTLPETKRYGRWPGEGSYEFISDRDKKFTENGERCHHYRSFPRTEHGELYYDDRCQIELQSYGWYHIHYKNFRFEMGEERFGRFAKQMFLSYLEARLFRCVLHVRDELKQNTRLRRLSKKTGLHKHLAKVYDKITTG